jgi:hypothetical protein
VTKNEKPRLSGLAVKDCQKDFNIHHKLQWLDATAQFADRSGNSR